jgi:hypothetical protein
MAYVWFRSTEEGKLEAVVWRPRYVRKVHDPLFLCDCGVPVPVYVCFFIRLSLGVAWDDV